MYCNVIDGKIFFSSGKLIPLHGLRREFIDVAMVALQPEDDRWNKADADEWRKQRVTDAQLRVLANYPECQHHLATDDFLTLSTLANFLITRWDESLPEEGDKTIFAHKSDNRAAIAQVAYRGGQWHVMLLKVLDNPTFLEMALAQKQAMAQVAV